MQSLHQKLASSRFAKSPNYIRRFGLANGARLLLQIERNFNAKSKVVRRFKVPGYPAPITLRDTRSDHAMFWQCIVECQYDLYRFTQSKRLYDAYCDYLNDGITPLIIDGGGNVGLAAIYLSVIFPAAHIYTVEPEIENFEVLKQNISHYGDRITGIRGAVWSEKGRVRIVNPEVGGCAIRVEASPAMSGASIQTYTIAEICKLAGAKSPFIVKLDVEGSQQELFRHNTEWVSDCHLIMIELDDWLMPWKGTSQSFFSCISRYPFEYLMHGETLFCFRDFQAGTKNAES